MSIHRERLRAVQRGFNSFQQRARHRRVQLGAGVSRLIGEERVSSWKDGLMARREQFRGFVHRYIDPESWQYPVLRGLAKYSLFFLLFLISYVFVLQTNFLYLTGALPTVEDLRNPKLNQASEIYSLDGVMIGKFYAENRSPIKYENIPKHLIQALVSTEDARFYDHGGIDPRAIGRAAFSFGRDGGGSTITQQLAKNLFKTRRRTNDGFLNRIPGVRKVIYKSKEWLMAITLERNFTKEEILTYYFNTVDFGSNSFGLKTAARTFFDKRPDSLNIQEGAVLVGLQKATTYYNPLKNPDNSLKRRNTVIQQMAKYEYITKAQADSITNLPLKTDFTPENPYSGPASYLKNAVQDFVQDWSNHNPNGYNLYTDGLKIYTTIDSRMQQYAEEATAEKMKRLQRTFDNHWKGRNPWTDEDGNELPGFIDSVARRTERYKGLVKKFQLYPDSVNYYMKVKKQPMKVFDWNGKENARKTSMTPYDSIAYYKHFLQSGMVAMDPHTGFIRAWVGGLDYDYFKYDHVKQGRRQPGSTFKPIVYTAAIDNGFSPCYEVADAPVTFPAEAGRPPYTPRNFEGKYSGRRLTLRQALGLSVNSVMAFLVKTLTPETVVEYAKRLGITSKLEAVPPIGFGITDVSIYELCGVYGTFVNRGVWTAPVYITRIEDKAGNLLYEYIPTTREVLSEQTAWLMTYMLQAPTGPGGTAVALRGSKYGMTGEFGGKTGTTSNYSDAWFMGITPELVCGTWVGGEDRAIHFRNGDLGQGARQALPIYGLFMKKALADKSVGVSTGPFPRPEAPLTVEIDCVKYKNGVLGDSTQLTPSTGPGAEDGDI